MKLFKLEDTFKNKIFNNEDDIKSYFYSNIISPLLKELNPTIIKQYKSGNIFLEGKKTNATFQNISFKSTKYNYFKTENNINKFLYGKDDKDYGLYDYILNNAKICYNNTKEEILNKISNSIGVGFDGVSFLFTRFVITPIVKKINTNKLNSPMEIELPLDFVYEKKNFSAGLKKLILLIKQQDKITLNKENFISVINPKNSFIQKSIKAIYDELYFNLNNPKGNINVKTLYNEWDKIFGNIYEDDNKNIFLEDVSSSIKDLYNYNDTTTINSKIYLFALQTFFNMFLKILVYSFLMQLINPMFIPNNTLTRVQINKLFNGKLDKYELIINNFFEPHFMEWFTYINSDSNFDTNIVNGIFKIINNFDLSTYILKPEEMQDILQEVYMGLIPIKMRHLMGEYFSPDWIVEHALDMVEYDGKIDKTLIDPTAGSGTFLIHAIKRIISKKKKRLSKEDIEKITHNIVGFDINPISVVSAKANYIFAIFSYCNDDVFKYSFDIPIYIADSILAPVVYTEESELTLSIDTYVGKFQIPKFDDYTKSNKFLKTLSKCINDKCSFEDFWNKAENRYINDKYKSIVENLFNRLYTLQYDKNNSFWSVILKNSFAPILISNKFDYVIGNPPWIAWKAMSKSYRKNTLKIWENYGIFEKNAYDKKTTHDDFGMVVTYVAIDKYLKDNGNMVFLLPVSFLKSTKGGEGFRKFSITRFEKNIPFAIDMVDDFSNVKLFTIPTIAIKIIKGIEMKYPMYKYNVWKQIENKYYINSHTKWNQIINNLRYDTLSAQPVDSNNKQSSWLTLENMDFANKVLDSSKKRFYSGRKGIEPAGAKGVFLLKKPIRCQDGLLLVENCIERQRRKDFLAKGINKGKIEETFVFPMLGGRNIEKWKVNSNEYILVPHTIEYKYGVPVQELNKIAPKTSEWLHFYYDELLLSRIQNGKFFNANTQPYYRLDNVGKYTYAPYKVLWKEQTKSMSAVVVSSYFESIPNADKNLFNEDKIIVVDSKVIMLGLYNFDEANYVCGILNSKDIVNIIDGYAISTNRGTDVLKYLAIPKYDLTNDIHKNISNISKNIHIKMKELKLEEVEQLEIELNMEVCKLFE